MRCSSCSNGWRLRSRTVIPVGGRNLLFGLGRSRHECGERGFEWGRSVTDLFDESGVYQCGECRRRFFCCGGGGSPGSGRGIERDDLLWEERLRFRPRPSREVDRARLLESSTLL